MARDLGRFGIRAVSIAPNAFETPLIKNILKKYLKETRLKDTPMNRFGQPYEFAHLAAGIVENTYINGVSLRIDGATKISNL